MQIAVARRPAASGAPVPDARVAASVGAAAVEGEHGAAVEYRVVVGHRAESSGARRHGSHGNRGAVGRVRRHVMGSTRSPQPIAAGALAVALVVGCTAAPGASPTPAVPEGTPRLTPGPPAVEPVPPTPAPIVGEVPPALVDAARADLATRIGADAAAAAENDGNGFGGDSRG